ncbi:MAG: hypothetical protein AABY00_02615 [Nanoarchaeota archaeon]
MDYISIRSATPKDLPAIVELENTIWPEGTRAPKEKFESRLAVFPEGFFLAFKNNQLIGASTSEIIDYAPTSPPTSWEFITDNGYIKNTHIPNGNALYIVSLGALSRSGGGSALLSRQKELAQQKGLQYLVLGARIPGYDSYCTSVKTISIEEYVKLTREDHALHDPELRFYTKNGLSLARIMPNYMEDDQESRNYGALMVWKNES